MTNKTDVLCHLFDISIDRKPFTCVKQKLYENHSLVGKVFDFNFL